MFNYDQNSYKRNLIDDQEANDKRNNAGLNSRTARISSLLRDQSFEIKSTVDGTDKQETIISPNYSQISLFSNDISHQPISENKGMNRLD
jgi:hypothetical protein